MLTKRNVILSLVVALVLAVATSGCSACQGPVTEPTPTAAPPAPTPTEVAVQPTDDESWTRVRESGTLRVGTAVDYPPFEYYDSKFRIDGFDIALIREIGERLGVDVEIRDIAFQGLGTALTLDRIDVAIGALSVTLEREREVDFTDVYYVSQDGILTNPATNIAEVTAVGQMAGGQIGVQAGSIYEEWIQAALVDTGLMPPESLFLYPKPEQAIEDLQEGKLHFVVLDLLPAELAARANDISLVGQGLNVQRYAMALPNGSDALRVRLNAALRELQDEGLVLALAKEYLDLGEEEVIPIPTPEPEQPTPTPVPTAAPPPCYDDMAYVADVTYDDQGGAAPPQILPGQAFVKTWRVRNTGTCTWDSSYTLNLVGGNHPEAHMGGSTVPVQGTVPPGAEYDVSANLVAPTTPGLYQGIWQMRNGSGVFYGDRLSVTVEVVSPTPVPVPTQTPSPNISYTADRTTIRQGECTTIRWDVQNVKAVYFYAEGGTWENNGVNGQGSREVCPTRTTTYYLRVVYPDNSEETRSLTIHVETAAESPRIVAFDAQPVQIQVGQCVDLYWDVQGDVNAVRITRNNAAIWDVAPVRGGMQDCPPGAGEMAYGLEATGPGGISKSVRVVTVVDGG